MNDAAISATRVIATSLWTLAAMLLVSAWLVKAFGPWEVAAMLGFTTLVIVAVAAMAQIRLYTMRVCKLIRASVEKQGASLHVMH